MRLSIDDGKDKDLSQPFQAETVKFKDLDKKKKKEYIWDYYKWHIIAVSFFLIIAAVVIPQILDNLKPTKLYVTMINCEWTSDVANEVLMDYADQYEIDTEEYNLFIDTSTIIRRNKIDKISSESAQKIAALIGNNTIDILSSDQANHEAYAAVGTYYDLEEILPQEFLDQYRDLLVYTINENTNEKKAFGINTTGLDALEGAFNDESITGIVLNSENTKEAVDFIYYLFDYTN